MKEELLMFSSPASHSAIILAGSGRGALRLLNGPLCLFCLCLMYHVVFPLEEVTYHVTIKLFATLLDNRSLLFQESCSCFELKKSCWQKDAPIRNPHHIINSNALNLDSNCSSCIWELPKIQYIHQSIPTFVFQHCGFTCVHMSPLSKYSHLRRGQGMGQDCFGLKE